MMGGLSAPGGFIFDDKSAPRGQFLGEVLGCQPRRVWYNTIIPMLPQHGDASNASTVQ